MTRMTIGTSHLHRGSHFLIRQRHVGKKGDLEDSSFPANKDAFDLFVVRCPSSGASEPLQCLLFLTPLPSCKEPEEDS